MRTNLLPAVVWGLRYAVLFAASRRFARRVSSASFCCSSVGWQLRYVGDMRRMLCTRERPTLVFARVARMFRHAANWAIPLGTSGCTGVFVCVSAFALMGSVTLISGTIGVTTREEGGARLRPADDAGRDGIIPYKLYKEFSCVGCLPRGPSGYVVAVYADF